MTSEGSGVLLIHKPCGITSHDVVDRVRKISGIRRIGHAGTLDPLAEGLLIILIGKTATKRQSEFMAGEKEYVATIRLGATSDTDDAEGRIVEMSKSPPSLRLRRASKIQIPNEIQIRECLKTFLGEIEQMPPMYSAIKVGGVKGYEAARRGETIALKHRLVTIREIELQEYTWPSLTIRVVCSPGTYIRSLARDIGEKLQCGAYLSALMRTRSGSFSLVDALPLDTLTPENWQKALLHSEENPYTLSSRRPDPTR